VADSGGADSMLWFRLEKGGDVMKHCQKKKRSQRARVGSIGRKCDGMTTLTGGERAPGMGRGENDVSWADANFTGLKNEENPQFIQLL
jgi:hypothetical protein